MPDICDLILDEHEQFRRRFAELDELRGQNAGAERLGQVWRPLAAQLELHAATEEEVFYPQLLQKGASAEEETRDAISDHNEIRDGVRRSAEHAPGTDQWWAAVLAARDENSDHMAEEERGAIPDFRINAEPARRAELGATWTEYQTSHPGGAGADTRDKDADSYIEERS